MNKAKELSILCNLKINISFYDPSINRVIEFASDPNFMMHEMVGRVNGDPLISPTITKVKHKLVTAEEIAVSDNIFKSEIDSNKNKIQKPKYLDEIEFAYISDTSPLLKWQKVEESTASQIFKVYKPAVIVSGVPQLYELPRLVHENLAPLEILGPIIDQLSDLAPLPRLYRAQPPQTQLNIV